MLSSANMCDAFTPSTYTLSLSLSLFPPTYLLEHLPPESHSFQDDHGVRSAPYPSLASKCATHFTLPSLSLPSP